MARDTFRRISNLTYDYKDWSAQHIYYRLDAYSHFWLFKVEIIDSDLNTLKEANGYVFKDTGWQKLYSLMDWSRIPNMTPGRVEYQIIAYMLDLFGLTRDFMYHLPWEEDTIPPTKA
jgi:hypothetical protein